jgi:tetratricopeptide (TPR) repeat protein
MVYPSWWTVVQALGPLDRAEAALRTLEARWKGHVLTLQYLAMTLHSQAKYEEAARAYGRILSLGGATWWTHLNRALVLQRLGRSDEAANSYLAALAGRPPEAKQKEAFDRLNGLAYGWAARRRFEDAERLWKALARLETLTPARKALTQLNLGILYFNHGEPERAGEAYRACLTLAPEDANAYNNLGLLMWSQKNLTGAKAAFAKASRFGALDTNGYENAGNLEMERGAWKRARAYFEEGLARARQKLALARAAVEQHRASGRGGGRSLENDLTSARYAVYRFRAYLQRVRRLAKRKQ